MKKPDVARKSVVAVRLYLAEDANLIIRHSYNLIAANLARLARFDDTIDADVPRGDHRFGSTPRGRKPKQFEENVQLDEVLVELEVARGHRTSG